MALRIIWLVVITLIALFCSTLAVVPVVRLLNKSENDPVVKPTISVRRTLIPTFPALAFLLALLASLNDAIMTLSLIALTLGIFAYYIGYRFASRLQQIPARGTRLLAIAIALAFVSTALWFAIYVYWVLLLIPIAIWLVIGFLTAELAIRHQMRRSKEQGIETNRARAVTAINYNQGRRSLWNSRYPFP